MACGGAGPARGQGAACRRLKTRCCCCVWLSGIWAASGEPWIPGETLGVAPQLLELDDFAVLARYDAEPTPLPAERRLLLEQLEAFHAEVRLRLS